MGVSQPLQRFINKLLVLLLIVPGRSTFRNLSRYSGYVEKTFSRWFRLSAVSDVTLVGAVGKDQSASLLS